MIKNKKAGEGTMNIIKELKNASNFSYVEQTIANYILEHREEVLCMSVQDLAKETHTSASGVIRLCKKLNFNGYARFKIELSAQLQKNTENESMVNANFPFQSGDSFKEISKKLYKLSLMTLQETYARMQTEDYKKSVQYMMKADKLAVLGIGDCYIRAMEFQNKLLKIGKTAIVPPISFSDFEVSFTLESKDCAIIISYSGETQHIIKCAKILFDNHVPIIGITRDKHSPLAKYCNIVLECSDFESQRMKFSTFASQEGIQFILNNLYAYYFVQNFQKNADQVTNAQMYTIINDIYNT